VASTREAGVLRSAAKRLTRGADLKVELAAIAAEFDVRAGVIVSLVGSLSQAKLRMAGGDAVKTFAGELEIVSATGTLGADGMHVHVSISDRQGTTFGGHLMDECIVLTTCEVVIIDIGSQYRFSRKDDATTGFKELVVTSL
jgi:uncharacterized protein